FARCNFREPQISVPHFERETLSAIAGNGSGWSVGAESDPVAIGFTRKIILEAVPFLLGLIEPVNVPDPLEIICALDTHQIDDMPVSRNVARWAFLRSPIPIAVPAKPVSVRLRSPLD